MRLPRVRFTVRRMMVAVAILGPLFLLVHPIQLAAGSGRLQQCQNNLRVVSLSLLGYATAKNEFPCAAFPNPTLPVERRPSWMLAITPYLDQPGQLNPFDQKRRGQPVERPYGDHLRWHSPLSDGQMPGPRPGSRTGWGLPASAPTHPGSHPDTPAPGSSGSTE